MSARNINPTSLAIIREEHQQLACVLRSMRHLVEEMVERDPLQLKFFRALLFYINEFPERVHHPKEEQYLFAKIKERTHQLDTELNLLTEQHSEGEQLALQLQTTLTRYEFNGTAVLPQLRSLVERYTHFYSNHIEAEEKYILPVALQVLSDADWTVVDQAFADNRQRLDQEGDRYVYEQLFAAIRSIETEELVATN
jgi:hemerythrin-like domain-containing protein